MYFVTVDGEVKEFGCEMEAWGRGIGLIMESCREQGLPAPEIKVVPPFVNLTIWFKHSLAGEVKNIYTPSERFIHSKSHPK